MKVKKHQNIEWKQAKREEDLNGLGVYRGIIEVYKGAIDIYRSIIEVYKGAIGIHRSTIDIYINDRSYTG